MRDPSPLQDSEDLEAVDSDDAHETRPISRRRDLGAQRTVPSPISNAATRRYLLDYTRSTRTTGDRFPLIDLGNDSTTPFQTSTPLEPSGFRVTILCNDPSSDEEEPASAATLADRLGHDHLPPLYEFSSDEDTEDGLERNMRRVRAIGLPSTQTYHRASTRKTKPSKIEIVNITDVSGGDREKEALAPHARFFIERTRRCVFLVPYLDHDTGFASQKALLNLQRCLRSGFRASSDPTQDADSETFDSVVSVKFDPPV